MGRPRGSRNRRIINMNDPENKDRLQAAAFPIDEGITDAEALRDNANAKRETSKAAAEIPEIFTSDQVEWVFDAYVAIICFIYSLLLKTDYKALETELKFDEDVKKQMAKPLAKICSKYAPSAWAGMTAEIELIMTLSVWTVASFGRAKNVAVAVEEKKKEAQRTQPVQPMRRPQEAHVPA